MTKEQITKWYYRQKLNKEKLSLMQITLLEKVPNWTWDIGLTICIKDHIELAKKLANKNKNMIPSYTWLKKNGYTALAFAVQKKPEIFLPLKQQRETQFISEHVQTATQLAKKNKNVLQSYTWLKENGYGGLLRAIAIYPEKFKHLNQECRIQYIDAHIALAEKLAKENSNKIPSFCWLKKNGYTALVASITHRPEKFKHLLREREQLSIEEHVCIAEKLAKKNKGNLPTVFWLQKNGYVGLYNAMRRFPKVFSHLTQERKNFMSVDEQVQLAEKLARENNNILPSGRILCKNGYPNLRGMMIKYPEKFAHIMQIKERIFVKEHVRVAEKLIKSHSNVLPSRGWLAKNGYEALSIAVSKYPEKFAHIPQEIRSGCNNKIIGFRGGDAGQRKELEIKNGLRAK